MVSSIDREASADELVVALSRLEDTGGGEGDLRRITGGGGGDECDCFDLLAGGGDGETFLEIFGGGGVVTIITSSLSVTCNYCVAVCSHRLEINNEEFTYLSCRNHRLKLI